MSAKRCTVAGTGNQSGYGDGEIISQHRSLKAACKRAREWYRPAVVRDSDGCRYNVYTIERDYSYLAETEYFGIHK